MEFREFLGIQEMEEGRILSGLKRGLAAGAVGAAMASPFFVGGYAVGGEVRRPASIPRDVDTDSQQSREVWEWLKDRGRYWSPGSDAKLRKAAEEGDEWAMRELTWPKDHEFHKLGRPYFKNDEPHPQGRFPQY